MKEFIKKVINNKKEAWKKMSIHKKWAALTFGGIFYASILTTSAIFLNPPPAPTPLSQVAVKSKPVLNTAEVFKNALLTDKPTTVELLRQINWENTVKRRIGYNELFAIDSNSVSKKFGIWMAESQNSQHMIVFLGENAEQAFFIEDMPSAQYIDVIRRSQYGMVSHNASAPQGETLQESIYSKAPEKSVMAAIAKGDIKVHMTKWDNFNIPQAARPPEEMTWFDHISKGLFTIASFIMSNIFSIFFAIILFIMIKPMIMPNRKFDIITPDKNTMSMDQLLGMDDVKAELDAVGQVLKNRESFESYGLNRPLNIAFSGPPGTGKTKAAGALARDLGLPLITMPAANLETGYVAGGANTLKMLHAQAKKMAPCIIFLDEAQTLFKKRGTSRESWADDTANSLLSILDGVPVKGEAPIIWIVASNFDNHNMQQDEAMARRFPMQVNFRMPNKEERKAILESYMRKKAKGLWEEEDVNFDYLAEITANLAPAKLENIVERASMTAVHDNVKIDTDAMFKAFERITIGFTDRETTKNKNEERRRIAIHECGHFVEGLEATVYKLERDNKPVTWKNLREHTTMLKISTEAISKMNALGYVLHREADVGLKGRRSMEFDIKGLYGGLAAEELFYGKDDISAGAHNDIEKISIMLSRMVVELGMYSDVPLNMFRVNNPTGQMEIAGKINDSDMEMVKRKAEELYKETKEDIAEYRDLINLFTEKLLDNYVLSIDEAFDLLQEHEELLPFVLDEETSAA